MCDWLPIKSLSFYKILKLIKIYKRWFTSLRKKEIGFGSTIMCWKDISTPTTLVKSIPSNQMSSLKIDLKWFRFWYLRLIALKTFIPFYYFFKTLIFSLLENTRKFILTNPYQNLEYSSIIFNRVNCISRFLNRYYYNSIGIYFRKFEPIF